MTGMHQRELAFRKRQLLRYLARYTSRATAPRDQKRAVTLKRHKVHREVRRMLALQEGTGNWVPRSLTPAESTLCQQLMDATDTTRRAAFLCRLLSPPQTPPHEEA